MNQIVPLSAVLLSFKFAVLKPCVLTVQVSCLCAVLKPFMSTVLVLCLLAVQLQFSADEDDIA